MTGGYRLCAARDAALSVRFGSRLDPAVNAHALATAARLRRRRLRSIHDIVVACAAGSVYFDPLVADEEDVRAAATGAVTPSWFVEVPVYYGGGRPAEPDVDSTSDVLQPTAR